MLHQELNDLKRHRVYLRCFANWPRPGVFFSFLAALVSHCSVRIDCKILQTQVPLADFMVDFSYVGAPILRSQGFTDLWLSPFMEKNITFCFVV